MDDYLHQLGGARIVENVMSELTDRLMKLQVDVGDHERTLVAGIAGSYGADELPGRNTSERALRVDDVFDERPRGCPLEPAAGGHDVVDAVAVGDTGGVASAVGDDVGTLVGVVRKVV